MIDATAADIREMRTHSSSVIARRAAEALLSMDPTEYRTVDEFLQDVERNSRVLRQANPSHAWLQSSQWAIVDALRERNLADPAEAADALDAIVSETIVSIESATAEAGAAAATSLDLRGPILTHDYSTTVLAAIEGALEREDHLSVYVTEARPRLMGRRMARTLGAIDGLDVTLIVDSAIGEIMPECNRVLTGMNCIVDGELYNRVGTNPIVRVANANDVPVASLGAAAKIVDEAFSFDIEYREAVEVIREPSPEFSVTNPAYDATPTSLLDAVVTENGVKNL